jgi:hypothetical protein
MALVSLTACEKSRLFSQLVHGPLLDGQETYTTVHSFYSGIQLGSCFQLHSALNDKATSLVSIRHVDIDVISGNTY